MYYLFTLTSLIIWCFYEINIISAGSHDKCCDYGENLYFDDATRTYRCTEDIHRRFGILAEKANFLRNNNSDGECAEALSVEAIVILTISEGKISQAEPVDSNYTYFPKCCPIGYIYNSATHGCIVGKRNENHQSPPPSFIQSPFIKVGLPHCKVIVDYSNVEEDIIIGNNSSSFCIDENEYGDKVYRVCEMDKNVCTSVRCVKKCCPDGQSFVNGAHCLDTYLHGVDLTFSSNIQKPFEPFAIISNQTCQRIYLMNENRYIFSLEPDGVFRYWHNVTNSFIDEQLDDPFPYCIEHSNAAKARGYFFFKCYVEKAFAEKFSYTLWPKIISCFFLIITMGVYMLLGETRNLFGKILMNYCVATLAPYSLLVYTQLDLEPTDLLCKIAGYALIFFSTATFTWLNVMCCDIWFTFGTTKHSVGSHQRRKDRKILFIYMTYGWGAPMILTLIIYLFSLKHILPESLHPYVGYSMCFIEPRNWAPLLFVRTPHLIIQIVNTVLFVKTIRYCLKIKDEINKINDTTGSEKKKKFKKDKERLYLIVKLAIVMGITYIFETTSGFVKMSTMGTVMKTIEIVWDFINCSQGILIFIIFICKRKIYNGLLTLFGIRRAKPKLQNQSTLTSVRTSLMKNNDSLALK